jgi:ribonucleotide monophosphatase NagD (HAD superfamily)
MDGVIYHGQKLLPGAKVHPVKMLAMRSTDSLIDSRFVIVRMSPQIFVEWLQQNKKKFLFLTNSSERSPRELRYLPH